MCLIIIRRPVDMLCIVLCDESGVLDHILSGCAEMLTVEFPALGSVIKPLPYHEERCQQRLLRVSTLWISFHWTCGILNWIGLNANWSHVKWMKWHVFLTCFWSAQSLYICRKIRVIELFWPFFQKWLYNDSLLIFTGIC